MLDQCLLAIYSTLTACIWDVPRLLEGTGPRLRGARVAGRQGARGGPLVTLRPDTMQRGAHPCTVPGALVVFGFGVVTKFKSGRLLWVGVYFL